MPDIIICEFISEAEIHTRIYFEPIFQEIPKTLDDLTPMLTKKKIPHLVVQTSRVMDVGSTTHKATHFRKFGIYGSGQKYRQFSGPQSVF